MSEQYINKKIAIQTRISKIWNVLVKKQFTKQWISEFSDGDIVTEDWHLHSKISMTDDAGAVVLEGVITEFEPNQRFKIEFENGEYTEELSLSAQDDHTLLSIHAGPVAPAEHKEHSEVWDKGLKKIKALSETQYPLSTSSQ